MHLHKKLSCLSLPDCLHSGHEADQLGLLDWRLLGREGASLCLTDIGLWRPGSNVAERTKSHDLVTVLD